MVYPPPQVVAVAAVLPHNRISSVAISSALQLLLPLVFHFLVSFSTASDRYISHPQMLSSYPSPASSPWVYHCEMAFISLVQYMSVTYGSQWPIICTGHPSSWCCHLPLGSSLPLVIPLGYFTTFRDSSTLPLNMYRVLENINSISKSHICYSHLSYKQ